MKLHTQQKKLLRDENYNLILIVGNSKEDIVVQMKKNIDYTSLLFHLRNSKNAVERHLKKLSTPKKAEAKKHYRFIQTSIDKDYRSEEEVV